MTQDEANKIAELIGYADSACPNCVRELVEHANRIIPEYKWIFIEKSIHEQFRFAWQDPNDASHLRSRLLVTVEPTP